MQEVKLLLKIILSVGFALALIFFVLSFSLMEMVTSEELALVIEATEHPPDTALLLSGIEANVVQNAFWLSLAAMGFCLIFLYYLYGNRSIFLAPGVLALIVFASFQFAIAALPAYLAPGIESPVEPVLLKGIHKAQLANYAVLAIGIVGLLVAATKLKKKFTP